MSKFLAPIHYRQYEKIKTQEKISEHILKICEENKWVDRLGERLNEKFPKLEKGQLEDIIDQGNIHMWLSNRIDLVEERLAFVVGEIGDIEARKALILEEVFRLARDLEIGELSIEEAFKLIDETFLDGMPCDQINRLINMDEIEASWERTRDIHSRYWKYGVSGEFYYDIRSSFISGLLEKSQIKYDLLGENIYRLKRIG